jgi:hypothetical protein
MASGTALVENAPWLVGYHALVMMRDVGIPVGTWPVQLNDGFQHISCSVLLVRLCMQTLILCRAVGAISPPSNVQCS